MTVQERPGIEERAAPAEPAAAGSGRAALLLLTALVLLLGALLAAVMVGPTRIAPETVPRVILAHTLHIGTVASVTSDTIIWKIRLPRALTAMLVGAILAGAGACYQSVFRNPLADPYLIGVASGAGLGAALAIALPVQLSVFGLDTITPAAFAGALLSVYVAYLLSRAEGVSLPTTLVLAGVAISYLASAAMSLIFMIDGEKFLVVFGWILGGFNRSGWKQVTIVSVYGLPMLALMLLHARLLNVLQLDDDQAAHLGVDVVRVRRRIIVLASLATAAAVSVSGLIGFVGLVVPHLARMLVGADARRLLPLAIVGGAIFVVCADMIARLVIAPSEVPIGIVTALTGGPFFLWLLRRRRGYAE